MVIHTGGNKRRGARTSAVTTDHGTTVLRLDGKQLLHFAPNFSVYVLPPDAVCLYSEDRKFFLHGQLYCALATTIGGERSVAHIVRDLQKSFPTEKIQEALKR